MGYSVKWIENNLGITREMLRYYEEVKILARNPADADERKPREYSDNDIKWIWNIKFLISIGFSTKEIYECMNNPDYDFDNVLKDKIAELEKEIERKNACLQFIKSIKLIGRIPTPLKYENVRFSEFIESVQKECNIYNYSQFEPTMQFYDLLGAIENEKFSYDKLKPLIEELYNKDKLVNDAMIWCYYQWIADMQSLGYDCDAVQSAVGLFYRFIVDLMHDMMPNLEITPELFARNMSRNCLIGEMSKMLEQRMGKEKCLFSAKAIAYYGGYGIGEN